ncbi:MAG: hypothetical protein AB1714_14945 [Acidobacteriota bacterium]
MMNRDEAIASPQLWNLYAYVSDNPITFLDPDGRKMRAQVIITGDKSSVFEFLTIHTAIRIYVDENPEFPDRVFSHGGNAPGVMTLSTYLGRQKAYTTKLYSLKLTEDQIKRLHARLIVSYPLGRDAYFDELWNNCTQQAYNNIMAATDSDSTSGSALLFLSVQTLDELSDAALVEEEPDEVIEPAPK